MKQLYIRKGNLESNQNILIIGEESLLGSRDSAYRAKGTLHDRFLVKEDPYTGAVNLIYIHACKNILLNSENFTRDYDIHKFLKTYCKDLLKWDGEANQGVTDSREAFIVKDGDVKKTVSILRQRILELVEPTGIFETIRSSRIFRKTHKKKRTRISRKYYRRKQKTKFVSVIAVFVIWCVIFVARGCFIGIKNGAYDFTYDYRNKMADENDEWLINKCRQLISEKGGDSDYILEAYYSSRFSGFSNYKVYFYNEQIVICIKKGLTVEQEQNAVRKACDKVIKHFDDTGGESSILDPKSESR